MTRGFLVKRRTSTGDLIERPYELRGTSIVLLGNRNIVIPTYADSDPHALIEAHERRMWSTLEGPIEILEFDSCCGSYLPSIARPLNWSDGSMTNPVDQNEIAKSYRREHNTIADDIERCFDVAGPWLDNFDVYGTQFEKIIYFSCVGVESLFNKILSDNSISSKNAGMKTFVKLKPFLRIDEHSLSMVHYPWLPTLRPFNGWDELRPSESLSWFDAYNSLKHDKQNNQHKATMQNALNAAAAYYALTYAVFGGQMFTGYFSEQFFFHFEDKPKWQMHELYFVPDNGNTWQPRSLSI